MNTEISSRRGLLVGRKGNILLMLATVLVILSLMRGWESTTMKTNVNSNSNWVIRPAMEDNDKDWKPLDSKVAEKEEGVQRKNSSTITMMILQNQRNHSDAPSKENTTTATRNITLLNSTLVVPTVILEQNGTIHTNGTNTSTSAHNSKGNLLSSETDREPSIITPKNSSSLAPGVVLEGNVTTNMNSTNTTANMNSTNTTANISQNDEQSENTTISIATPLQTISNSTIATSSNALLPELPLKFPDAKWIYEKVLPLNITSFTEEQEAVLQTLDDSGGGATTCAWRWNESDISQGDCPERLQPVTRNITRWYFLGDSTMARPWQWCMVPKFVNRSTTLKQGAGIKLKRYLGISRSESLPSLKPINVSRGEGPYNPKFFYKTGCTTCQNRLVSYTKKDDEHTDSNNSTSRKAYAEFLSMEYVRDVAFATKDLDTTQEVVRRYMERQQQQEQNEYTRTACVYSAGLHDIKIANITDIMYLENFKAMYTMMKDHCDIWIQLEQNANGFRFVAEERSRRLFLWNEGIRRILSPGDFQIQLFERSLNARHGDNIHMDRDTFYGPLADFLFSLMNVADTSV